MAVTYESKFIGSIFGSAIGDALGMPLTGFSRSEIAAMGPVADFRAASDAWAVLLPLSAVADPEADERLGPGQWTDDTQLTLALAGAIVAEGGIFVPDAWAHALVRWLNESPRAPGLSSLEAAIQLRTGGALWDEAADPEGGGCGAATRAAVAALAFPHDPFARRRCAHLQAMTTHGHPDAQAAAVGVAEAVALALSLDPGALRKWNGAQFLESIIAAVRAYSPLFEEFARCLEIALALLADDVDPESAVRALGVTAWAREAVPTALYLVARDPSDLEHLLIDSLNLTGGAVESIASMVGAVGGALHGVSALPARWRRGVEDPPRLLDSALALHRLHEGPGFESE